MQEIRKRKVTLDFQAFGQRLLEVPEPTSEELRRARRAHDLLGALLGTAGPSLDARYLMGLSEEVFKDARDIVTGEATDAASRAVAESVDEDQWYRLRIELE
ncbi:MAG: hypothetical protein ACFB50_12140 [Rubrobacteraceae bacterium]